MVVVKKTWKYEYYWCNFCAWLVPFVIMSCNYQSKFIFLSVYAHGLYQPRHFEILKPSTGNEESLIMISKMVCEIKFCWIMTRAFFLSFQCPLLNISYCPPTEAALSKGKTLVRIHLFVLFILFPRLSD